MHGSATVDVPDLLAQKLLGYVGANLLCSLLLLVWCSSTDSLALTAYTYLTFFNMLSMLTCLVSQWVTNQHLSPFSHLDRSHTIIEWGQSEQRYERFEVLAVFASTILAQLGALFIMKESVERLFQQPDIHTGRLLIGTAVAFISHVLVTYNVENRAFDHVVSASSSSWLQEHMSDMSESLCHMVPGLSKLLLPRINPFILIACAGAVALVITHLLIDVNNYFVADTWAAIWIALMTCGTMFPLSVYSGKILLHTTPSHTIGQLDKCIREASTLDGVLEFRHEHFWTVSFGKMAGSVHVRVRRDADEQIVLSHVFHRLANLISVLTVQIFKDDWSRPTAFHILGDTNLLSKTTDGAASQGIALPTAPSYVPRPQFPSHVRMPQPYVPTAMSPPGQWQYGPPGGVGFMDPGKDGAPLRSTLTPHAGVRFPTIPHYTDMASGSQAKYVSSVASGGVIAPSGFVATEFSGASARDIGDKYK